MKLINKLNQYGIKHFKDAKASIEYLSDIKDIIYSNKKQKINKKHERFIAFFDTIAYMLSIEKLTLRVIRCYLFKY